MSERSTTSRVRGAVNFDLWLFLAVLVFAAFGAVMVLSASGVMAEKFHGGKHHFFTRQLFFLGAGFAGMLVLANLPKKILRAAHYPALGVVVLLLLLTLFSPLGVTINGARRWLKLGSFSIQPMEFAKIALVFYLAWFFGEKQKLIKSFSVGVAPPFAVTGFLCLLTLAQPDFGGAAVLAMLLFFMCFVGGTRFIYLFASILMAAGGAALLISSASYRMKRFTAFLDPFEDAKNTGYQLVQSLFALGSGGIWGKGLGEGKQKLFYLPEAHNDFIMAVVGEELGLIGVSMVFVCIAFIVWRAFGIILAQEDMKDRLLTFGVTIILALGAVLNMAVVLGAAPPKGVPMPFLSYGGSNLLTSFACIGVLLNYSRGVRQSEIADDSPRGAAHAV